MKLAVKITLVGIIIMTLVIGSMLVIAITTSQAGLEQQIGQKQLDLTSSVMSKIDFVLYTALQDIKTMAEDEEFEGAVSGYKDLSESKQKLAELLLLTGPWYNLELYSVDGNLVLDATGKETGKFNDKASPELRAFQSVVAKEESFVSDVVVVKGKPTMIFAAPIHDETVFGQSLTGVVLGRFAWPVIEEILPQVNVEHAHMYNSEGYLIASNQPGDKSNILTEQDLIVLEHHQHFGDDFEVGLSNEGNFEAVRAHSDQKGHLTYKGHKWVLLLETPTAQAFSSIRETTRNLLIAGLLLLIVTILVAFFVARSIAKPIIHLKESADKISAGNLGERIEFKGDDELAELAESFDNMRYSLNTIIAEYENIKGKEELTKQLRESQDKFKVLFEQSPDGILVCDAKTGEVIDFNNQIYQSLGYTKAEFGRLKVSDFEEINKGKSILTLAKGGIFETKYKRKDKQLIDVLVTSKPVKIAGMDVMMVIVKDVTEEKKAEKKYKFIFENTSDALIVVDPETTKIIDFNLATQTMLGYSADELFKMTIPECYPPNKLQEITEIFQDFATGARKGAVKLEFIRKDKKVILVDGNMTKVNLGDKEVVLGSFRANEKNQEFTDGE